MARKKAFKQVAFLTLFSSGILVFLLGVVIFGIGLALTHHDTFNDTVDLKAEVRPRIDYVQYWIGLPFAITSFPILCYAFYLRRVKLIACTLILSLVCVVLALAGLVVDGPDFSHWKNMRAKQNYWERQDGFACSSGANTCDCKGNGTVHEIAGFTDCDTIKDLASVYGVLIGCMVIGLVILLAVIFMIVYVITTKREKAHRSKSRYRSTKIITVTDNDAEYPPVSSNPIYDAAPKANRGFDMDPAPPQGYDNGRLRTLDKAHDDTLRIQGRDGVVMMDPGRFKLGDDDIY